MDTWSPTGQEVHDAVDREFWAIVCAEEDLLRAEFEAIVEASTPQRRVRGSDGSSARPQRPPRAPGVPAAPAPGPGRGGPRRLPADERSPPPAAGPAPAGAHRPRPVTTGKEKD